MAGNPLIGVSGDGVTGNMSLTQLAFLALAVAIGGLALAGPQLDFADEHPGQHLLNLAIYALLCALPFAFFPAVLLSFLLVAAAPRPAAPRLERLASATFNAAAAAALLLAAVLFLRFLASVDVVRAP